jgi:hypothetical protein
MSAPRNLVAVIPANAGTQADASVRGIRSLGSGVRRNDGFITTDHESFRR